MDGLCGGGRAGGLTLETMVMKAWAMGKGRLSGDPDSKHSFIRERPCFPQNRQT